MITENENINKENDDVGESQIHLNKETMTENEDPVPVKCKYCSRRLSKLRKIERIKSVKRMEYIGMHGKDRNKHVRDKGCQTPSSLYKGADMTHNELRNLASLLSLRGGKTLQTEAFCKCVANGQESDCQCGEEDKCRYCF